MLKRYQISSLPDSPYTGLYTAFSWQQDFFEDRFSESILPDTWGGGGCHLRVVPPGQLLRRPSTPKRFCLLPFIEPGFSIFCDVKFFVFALRLLCLFLNSFQFKFFIYSLYIHIYISYIFFHCTCGVLQCSRGLWSLCRANSRWQTRSPAVGAL